MMTGLWAVNLHMDKRLAANRLVSCLTTGERGGRNKRRWMAANSF